MQETREREAKRKETGRDLGNNREMENKWNSVGLTVDNSVDGDDIR